MGASEVAIAHVPRSPYPIPRPPRDRPRRAGSPAGRDNAAKRRSIAVARARDTANRTLLLESAASIGARHSQQRVSP